MTIKISKRIAAVGESPTLAITAKAKALRAEGVDVIGFGAGEPDFDTPEPVKEACIDALRAGFTKYCPAAGIPELREAIRKKLVRENGVEYPLSGIAVTAGAKHALYAVILAILDDGDEAVIPSPYWVTYPEQVKMAGAKPVFVETREEDGFSLKASALEKVLTEKTRLLILNTPNNPTGAVIPREDIEEIAALAKERDLLVISDECYEKLIYDGAEHFSIASLPGMNERTIVVNAHSKTFAMTGWRVGFAAGPTEIIKPVMNVLSQSTSNITSFAQKGAVAAFDLPADLLEERRKAFDERRKFIVSELNSIPGIRCIEPKGAFYVFPNVEGTYGEHGGRKIASDRDLADYLLDEAKVAIVFGEAFGAPGYARLSYATSMEKIKEGLSRIRKALSS